MAKELQFLVDERYRARNKLTVSVNPKMGRLRLGTALAVLEEHHGGPVDWVKLGVDPDEQPLKHFWLVPCEEDEPEARKVQRGKYDISVSAKILVSNFGWTDQKTVRYVVEWDDEYGGLKVDTTAKI